MSIQILCFILAVILIIWLPVWDLQATLRQFDNWEHLVVLICGIAAFPLLISGLYAYTRYGLMQLGMHQEKQGVLWSGLFAFLGVPIILVPFRLNAPLIWILLGLAIGCILDIARRNGHFFQGKKLLIDKYDIQKRHHRLPIGIREKLSKPGLNPLRCPRLLP